MTLPADSHVHSEFSWDTGGPASAARGTMEATCARAVRIGLPALFFTEHLDLEDAWVSDPEDFDEHEKHLLGEDGTVHVPRFDVEGYLESVERCRAAFPELRIGTGLEFGQPHLRTAAARQQRDLSLFDRILGSLHTLEHGDARAEPNTLYRRRPALLAGGGARPGGPARGGGGVPRCDARRRRERPGARDEHAAAVAVDAAVVARGGRARGELRQRRPPRRRPRPRLPGGRRDARGGRLPSRRGPAGPLAPLSARPAQTSSTRPVSTPSIDRT